MKIISERLKRVLDFAGQKSVRQLTKSGNLTCPVLKKIEQEYSGVLKLCGQMFKVADDHDFPVCLEPQDPRWEKFGFANLCTNEIILIRRLCERDGYPVAFTPYGLIVPPKVRRIRPLSIPVAQAC